MFQEMFVSLILEIEEKSERYMETGLKLGAARDDMKKAIGLANALSEKYGSKYSFEGKVVERLYSEEEIEVIKAELLDKSILTLIKRLLGFGKKTGEIYAELMGKLTGLIGYLRNEIRTLEKELSEREAEIRTAARQVAQNAQIINSGTWSTENCFLKFGNVIDRFDVEAPALAVIQSEISKMMKGQLISLPYVRSTEENLNFSIQYKSEQDRILANGFTRALLYQLIRKTGDYQRVFHLIDGAKTGSDFGELLSLQKIRKNNVWEINTSVSGGYYQYANIYLKNSEIRNCLKSMDEFISRVATEAGSYEDLQTYNASPDAEKKGKIPQQIIVIQNFPHGFNSDEDFELLAKLMNNGRQRGVSIFIQYELSKGQLFEEKIRSRLNRGPNGNEELLESVLIQEGAGQLIANDYSSAIGLMCDLKGNRPYIDALVDEKTKIKIVDNSFSGIYHGKYPSGGGTAVDGLIIPFAVNWKGNVKNLVLDSKTNINCLISGTVGSGKSTLLHCLILTLSMYYRPEEVEIWLSDYKIQEFNTYKLNAPPNVAFIGLSDSEDFTYAFLDKIWEEYERRTRLFVKANDVLSRQGRDVTVNDFRSYRKYAGKLPRLVIIVDEFHIMSQHVMEELSYRDKLENLLSQARGAGITFILSDQSITAGLAGLTPKARNQMNCRLALSNTADELKEMLRTNNAEEIKPFGNMKTGDCVLVSDVEVRQKDGSVRPEKALEQVRVIYLNDQDRPEVCRHLQEAYGKPDYMPRYVDQKEPVLYSDKVIDSYEKSGQRSDAVPVYFGEALDLSGLFRLNLEFRRGENIISVGGSDDQQIRLVISAISSFRRRPDHRIFIIADHYSKFITQHGHELEEVCRDPQTFLIDEEEEMCEKINELLGDMRNRRKQWNTLVLWLGLDEICSNFQNFSDLKPEKYVKISEGRNGKQSSGKSDGLDSLLDDMDSKFSALFGDDYGAFSEDEKGNNTDFYDNENYDEEELYNITDDVVRILKESSKRGIFNMAIYDSVISACSIREIRLEYFKHKMSFILGRDDCMTYYGRANLMATMKPDSDLAAYYDGRSLIKFKPFVLNKKEGRQNW